MARQEQVHAQTISDMKKALLRNGDDSESDESITQPTNRGNKLKRKARSVQEGRLVLSDGVQAYRKKINYNGYFREVISKNPLRLDPDGDVVDQEDEELIADVEDAEEDPYREVRIENLLMPLTAAADLKKHPTLSTPYTSKVLEEMLSNAQALVQREQEALWRVKQLTSEFRGDSTWMPCGNFQTDTDSLLFTDNSMNASAPASVVPDGDVNRQSISQWDGATDDQRDTRMEEAADAEAGHFASDGDSAPHDAYENPPSPAQNGIYTKGIDHMNSSTETQAIPDTDSTSDAQDTAKVVKSEEGTASVADVEMNEDAGSTNANEVASQISLSITGVPPTEGTANEETTTENDETNTGDQDQSAEEETLHPPHRMTTRARAQAANSSNGTSPTRALSPSNAAAFIHPFFNVPSDALSSQERGLPPDEADETRRLLAAYVQKQEEVCRGATKLYMGLLRAKKMRDDVLEWCTAEGHVGEMSDGEDWYDKERWGLVDDLRKGEELDDEEVNVTGKKTRNRRTARDA